jgi:hypothetical protein
VLYLIRTEDKWIEYLKSEKLLYNHKPSTDIKNITRIEYQSDDNGMLIDYSKLDINLKKIKTFLSK